ncbi:hypothetical protein C7451_105238 [Blastomonas natatoria]|uniref:DUF1643 domain-containing protein n=1 Tax=Blastomonas natatoria TaxID=34015 RepID=A0A2V3V3W6_9SPHN|nr:DUF1643 domain-containing protein [Blastomonas natatoria]PXW76463.1 hypothetical protein C7451_105238 [Blastomonas natatoria]
MSAVLSPCENYRYRLERNVSMFGPVAAVIMVNPSTADAEVDDATIRRVVGFGKRLGWSKVIVGNVFAYRATDIRHLARASDPVGPDNAMHLREILEAAEVTIVAWGTLSKLPVGLREQWRIVSETAESLTVPLKCFGVTKDGHPRHPLMISYQTALEDWCGV